MEPGESWQQIPNRIRDNRAGNSTNYFFSPAFDNSYKHLSFHSGVPKISFNQPLFPQVVHVIGQLESSASTYSCLWEGCKVFGKPSSSRGWVEKHVALHGGKFAFPCIVEGCRHRFSSQVHLQIILDPHQTLGKINKCRTEILKFSIPWSVCRLVAL